MTSQPASSAGVVGMGMVAALGDDVAMNCAAARAGLVRSGVLENYRLRSAVEGRPEPVIGHTAGLLTRGFEGDVRLVRLAQGALANLLKHTPHIDWKTRRAGCYVALPAEDRARRAPNPEAQELGMPPAPVSPATEFERARQLLAKAAALSSWPAPMQLGSVTTSGHAGGLEAVRAASEDLRSGRFDTAIVLAVDSLLDERSLDWLNASHRLKCDGIPDGLQPGEAAVAIALVSEGAPAPELKASARLLTVHTGKEPRHLLSDEPARGEVLSAVVEQAWSESRAPLPWLIMDLNGEIHRAMDWGYALVRLRASSAAFSQPLLWYPAASFGDTGAASALIGICLSVRSWKRGYAPGDCAVVTATSDGDARAAVAVMRN